MTLSGATERQPLRLDPLVRFLVGVAGLAFSITILWLSMRAVVAGIGAALWSYSVVAAG
jgi:hypothetical protein